MPSAIRILQPAGGNSQETSLAPLADQTPDGDITISASSLLSAASCLGLRVSHGLMIRLATKNHSNPPRFTLLATSKRHPTGFAKILDFQARVKPLCGWKFRPFKKWVFQGLTSHLKANLFENMKAAAFKFLVWNLTGIKGHQLQDHVGTPFSGWSN